MRRTEVRDTHHHPHLLITLPFSFREPIGFTVVSGQADWLILGVLGRALGMSVSLVEWVVQYLAFWVILLACQFALGERMG